MVEQQEPPSLAEVAVKDPTVFTWFTIVTVTSTAIPILRSGHMKSAAQNVQVMQSHSTPMMPMEHGVLAITLPRHHILWRCMELSPALQAHLMDISTGMYKFD